MSTKTIQSSCAEHGTADASTVHLFLLWMEEEEAGILRLDEDEYHESKWWDIEEIQGEKFHPCIVNVVKMLKCRKVLDRLEREVDKVDINEKDVALRAINFVKAMRESKPDSSSVQVFFDSKASKYVYQDNPK